jgi:Uma2 family endonuclease
MMGSSEMVVEYARRPITVEEYQRMGEVGIIGPGERVELVDGELIAMPPIGDAHGSATTRLTLLFIERFNRRAIVWTQGPIVANDISEPEPDLTLVRWDPAFLIKKKPRPGDIHLIIEAADCSLGFDRIRKRRLYASAGIPEYWILNLVDETVEVFRDVKDGEYQTSFTARDGEALEPQAFPDDVFSVAEMVGHTRFDG